jgi:hypothetical protein
MVLTILEAEVEKRNWGVLKEAYELMTRKIPLTIKSSFLAQDQSNNAVWRILTIWESQEALTAMRESAKTPTGVLIFEKANAKPKLTIYDIQKERSNLGQSQGS